LGSRICLPKPRLFGTKKPKSKIELASQELLAYLVGLGLDRKESSKLRLSTIVRRFSV